jgi:protein-tyrosine phosphatase
MRRRLVPFEGPVNFRDIGGYRGHDGQVVRWGKLYRSDGLNRLTEADLREFDLLGVKTVYDLRSDTERLERPDPMPSVHVNVEAHVPREEFEDGSALQTAQDAENRLRDVYLATLGTGAHLLGQLLSALAEPENLPAVVHCAGGKDRTGLAVALVLGVLGVDRPTILDDYELTNQYVTEARLQEVLELFMSVSIGREAGLALLKAPRWAMAEALDWMDAEYGGTVPYLRRAAGLPDPTIQALQTSLLEVSE